MDYCTLYIDGSGDYLWPPPDGKGEHKYHTLAGLILEPNSDLKGKNEVNRLLKNYVPEYIRNNYSVADYELHYVAINGGSGLWRKIKKDAKEELIEKTYDLILDLNPILVASTVDKSKEKENFGKDAYPPEIYAMRSVVNKFSMYLTRKNKIGTIVYDAEKYNFDLLLQEAILGFRKYGIEITGWNYQPRHIDYLPNLLNNVNFCPSHMSSGIQLADFVASAVWRKYERTDSKWYDKLYSLWEYDENRGRHYYDSLIPGRFR